MSTKLMTAIWDDSTTKGLNLFVLIAMADNANDQGICWPSVATIAHKVRVNERTVQRAIRELAEGGHLTIQPGGGRRSNTYRIFYPAELRGGNLSPVTQLCHPSGDKGAAPAVTQLRHPSGDTAMSPEPLVEPSLEPPVERAEPKAPRPRNTLFDALCEIEGSNPLEIGRKGGRIAGALRQIKEATPDVTPDEIKRRAANYRETWPTITLTATALATHWAKFGWAETAPLALTGTLAPMR